MQIIPNEILNSLLIKHTDSIDTSSKAPMTDNANFNLELSTQEQKSLLTIALDKKPLLKLPLEEVLKELGIKDTPENLMILEKLITSKNPLSPKKFLIISQLLNENPLIKEELLDFLFNPFCNLILLNDQEK
ncbi:MAG: hypothetical protein ACOYJ1_15185, partial [Peptococcales bacterium]